MVNCINCSAPLPANSNICQYCGTRNDIDLRGIHKYTTQAPESERICPRCDNPLQTINLKIEGRFLIEKCGNCFGLFFDPGELEALLDKTVANVFDINYSRIGNLRNQPRHDEYPVRYIKCPVCGKLMNRINFASQSGVIVDRCKDHGVWLDGGELKHLMEWVKAGGQLLHHKTRLEQERLEIQREKQKLRQKSMGPGGLNSAGSDYGRYQGGFDSSTYKEPELLTLISRFISKLFL